jgi:hypothetical protein
MLGTTLHCESVDRNYIGTMVNVRYNCRCRLILLNSIVIDAQIQATFYGRFICLKCLTHCVAQNALCFEMYGHKQWQIVIDGVLDCCH